MSNSGTTHLSAGGGSGKVAIQDFSFTKYVDKSSPALFLKVCNGGHFADATFVAYVVVCVIEASAIIFSELLKTCVSLSEPASI